MASEDDDRYFDLARMGFPLVRVNRWADAGEQVGPFHVVDAGPDPRPIDPTGEQVEWGSSVLLPTPDELVYLGGWWAMPFEATVSTMVPVEVSGAKTPLFVMAKLQLLNTRRLEVVELQVATPKDPTLDWDGEHVEPHGISPKSLRQVPLASIIAREAFRHLTCVEWEEDGTVTAAHCRPTPEDVADGPTPLALEILAGVYRAAVIANVAPVKAVCTAFEMPRPRAADWIKRARSAGLIDDEWRPKGKGSDE